MCLLFYLSCVFSSSHLFTGPASDPHCMLCSLKPSLSHLSHSKVSSTTLRPAKPSREHFPSRDPQFTLPKTPWGQGQRRGWASLPSCAGETGGSPWPARQTVIQQVKVVQALSLPSQPCMMGSCLLWSEGVYSMQRQEH